MAENKNKLGKDFKQQTWYSNFLKKPIEKIQAILSFKKYELKDLQIMEYRRITESLEGMIVHMSSASGRNQEQFKLIKKIGCIGFDAVFYSAKRLSDKREVCRDWSPKFETGLNIIREPSQITFAFFGI